MAGTSLSTVDLGPLLQPFVIRSWVASPVDDARGGSSYEDRWIPSLNTPIHRHILPKENVGIVFVDSVGLVVTGCMTKSHRGQVNPGGRMLGLRLRPGRARTIVGTEIDSLTDTILPFEDVWGRDAREIEEQLFECKDSMEGIGILGRALQHRVKRRSSGQQIVDIAIEMASKADGAVRVQELCDRVGVGRRRLLRHFRREVGLSPKRYCRILRFHALLKRAQEPDRGSWADLAAELGFFDQAHLISELRDLTGENPTALFGAG